MSWRETVACYKFDAPISIPEQDRVQISVLQKPFEEVIYNRMLRLSYETGRNFCRVSYAALQETTSLRSKNAVITGIQGLIEKRHIIKLLNDEGKLEMNREGTLYRVLSPTEALRGVLDDGAIVSEIDRDGVPFHVTEKKIHAAFPEKVQKDTADQGIKIYTPQGNIEKSASRAGSRIYIASAIAVILGGFLTLSAVAAWRHFSESGHNFIASEQIQAPAATSAQVRKNSSRHIDKIRQAPAQNTTVKDGERGALTPSEKEAESQENPVMDTSAPASNVQAQRDLPTEKSVDAKNAIKTTSAENTPKPKTKPVETASKSSSGVQTKTKSLKPRTEEKPAKINAQSAQKMSVKSQDTKKPSIKPIIKQPVTPAPKPQPSNIQENPLTIIE
jgi:hypothetical protein